MTHDYDDKAVAIYLYITPLRRSGPKTALLSVAQTSHWSICVRNTVYEVRRSPENSGEEYELAMQPHDDWRRVRPTSRMEVKLVGLTKKPDEEIQQKAEKIWGRFKKVHVKGYDLKNANCQVFARWLFNWILIPDEHPRYTVKERLRWQSFPTSFPSVASMLKWLNPAQHIFALHNGIYELLERAGLSVGDHRCGLAGSRSLQEILDTPEALKLVQNTTKGINTSNKGRK